MDFTFPTLASGPPTSPQSVAERPVEDAWPAQIASSLQVPLTARSTVVDRSAGALSTASKAAATTAAAREVPGQRAPIIRQKESDWGTKALYRFLARFFPIALEKGYSQVDWLRLTRNNSDLNCQHGAPLRKDLTLSEVRKHNTEHDAWMVLKGKVYNISPYLRFHPGGADILLKAAGRDGTALFNKYHTWVNGDALLEKCLIGWIAQPPALGIVPAAPAAAPPPPPIPHTDSEGEEEAAVDAAVARAPASAAVASSHDGPTESVGTHDSHEQRMDDAGALSLVGGLTTAGERAFVAAAKVSTASPRLQHGDASHVGAAGPGILSIGDTAIVSEQGGIVDSAHSVGGSFAGDGQTGSVAEGAASKPSEQKHALLQPRLSSGSLAVAACLS